MRYRSRQLWVALAVVIILGAIILALLLRRRAAPDAVRLLPDADAVLYINFEPIRLLTSLGKHPPKDRDPQYEDFVRQTGFDFERDLDRAAVAIHYGSSSTGKPAETRYSEIFQGHFDRERVNQYLGKLAANVERYRDLDIYAIPHEGRTVRVALVGIDIAAISNTDGPGAIHGMIDRYKKAALPFSGPALVSQYYRQVPLGSVVWTIATPPTASRSQNPAELLLPGAWSGLLPAGSVVIASARPLNDIHIRALVITKSDSDARSFTDRVSTYLAIFKSLDIAIDAGGPDPDVKAAFDSLQVRQDKDEAVLTAKVPYGFFKKLMSEPPVDFGSEAEPAQKNQPEANPLHRSK